MILFKKIKNLILSLAVISVVFTSAFFVTEVNANASDIMWGGTEVDVAANIGLGDGDPRVMIARVINVFLGFLGIIAVGLVMYAGFMWMTSNGDQEKIEKAKKTLIAALIGIVIIMSAFAIASFVINKLYSATVGGGVGGGGVGGGGVGGGGGACSSDADCGVGAPVCCIGSGTCAIDISACTSIIGGIGSNCNATTTPGVCDGDDSMCNPDLFCETSGPDSCTCQGPPIIDWISPEGSFCDDDVNAPCWSDIDCGTTCNIDTPNGAVGNFATIGGRYFGTTTGQVFFYSTGTGTTSIPADLANVPPVGNPLCASVWEDDEIVVIVPAGTDMGAIRVLRADGEQDSSDDSNGPLIDDFVINTIDRPGVCGLSTSTGIMGDNIDFYGIKFDGSADPYFGRVGRSIIASGITNTNDKNISGGVPNINRGRTTTYALNSNNINSNYKKFTKLPEPYNGPYITSFDPITAAPGAYVTIYGSGFGDSRGTTNHVYFGPAGLDEADYDFPDICIDSVWTDNQVVVKVPSMSNGDYTITMEVKGWTIDTSVISPNVFYIDNSLSLYPSLCKIKPTVSPNNSPIDIYGEYFGASNTAQVLFHDTVSINGDLSNQWLIPVLPAANNIDINIPSTAISGPVRVMQGGPGNSLNLLIGECTAQADPDAACGTQICCPNGTPEGGRCADTFNDCAGSALSSVFEWDFSTELSTSSLDTNESCSGYDLLQCTDTYFCPNSPGQCSPYAGGDSVTLNSCQDSTCDTMGACTAGTCTYIGSINKCVNSQSCDLDMLVTGVTEVSSTAYCDIYTNNSGATSTRWHLNTTLSCPATWNMISGNRCVDLNTTCDLCSAGFKCLDNAGSGVCGVDTEICKNGSTCDGTNCTYNKDADCECCCRKPYEEEDCCTGLTCEGSCGTGINSDELDLGVCSGCRIDSNEDGFIDAAEQLLSNQACNCEGTYGKFCNSDVDIDGDGNPDGVCEDCATIKNVTDCTNLGTGTCCADGENGNRCKGGTDYAFGFADNYCAYYECSPVSTTACNTTAVASSTERIFRDLPTCITECAILPPTPGASCTNIEKTDCAYDFCRGATYDCIFVNTEDAPANECGFCCCDPTLPPVSDTCALVNPNLECMPNQTPCTTTDRGLCCGCTDDLSCGSPLVSGCGADDCCRARPSVFSTLPADDATSTCRNVLIRATFTEKMDLTSFIDNIIVLADYGSGMCPNGTAPVAYNDYFDVKLSFFEKIKNKLRNIFGGSVNAYTVADPDHNYCAIAGSINSYNNIADQGVVEFSTKRLFDSNRMHYVILRGDPNLDDDRPEGVLNEWMISMNETADTSADYTFNGITYDNSYIWSFETGNEICKLTDVRVNPSSYLFQSHYQSESFEAEPLTDSGQIITGIPTIYDWKWEWESENNRVVVVSNNWTAGKKDPIQDVTSQVVEDGSTYVNADAVIIADNIFNTIGNIYTGESHVYVFVCENPWPAIIPLNTPPWSPWIDKWSGGVENCMTGPGTCAITNYELYYCRDQGNVGTADDIPAIENNAIARRETGDYVKEVYYFRATDPGGASILNASNTPTAIDGGSVTLDWGAVAGTDGYKVYWGTRSGQYDDYQDVGNILAYNVEGLLNGVKYYFNLTSYESGNMSESSYYGEVEAVPQDVVRPGVPTGFHIVGTSTGSVELAWNTASSAVSYEIFYGTVDNLINPIRTYLSSEVIGSMTGVIINGLIDGNTYYFAVKSIDINGNRSYYSLERSISL